MRIKGDFVSHDHPETDEAFIVIDGTLRIDFRDRSVVLGPGEMFVVPKGTEHKPFAAHEVRMLLIEPRGTLNTGHEGGERTAQNDVWNLALEPLGKHPPPAQVFDIKGFRSPTH